MRIAIALAALALFGCSSTPPPYWWDSTRPKPDQPFKDWVHGLGGYDLLEQAQAVEETSLRLPETSKTAPSWSDLLDELFLERKWDLLYMLLDGRQLPAGHYEALGAEFAVREDERALNLLDEFVGTSKMTRLRPSAVWILGSYCRLPAFARRLSTRLVPIALEDPNPTTRAYAIHGLGMAGQPDSVPVLRMALQDKAPVVRANSPKGVMDTVSQFAEEALQDIEKKTGKTYPRNPPK